MLMIVSTGAVGFEGRGVAEGRATLPDGIAVSVADAIGRVLGTDSVDAAGEQPNRLMMIKNTMKKLIFFMSVSKMTAFDVSLPLYIKTTVQSTSNRMVYPHSGEPFHSPNIFRTAIILNNGIIVV